MSTSRKHHFWTTQEKEYLKKIASGKQHIEIVELMSKRFNHNYTMMQIKGALSRYHIKTGLTGRYEKGNIPYNKGTKGISKPNKTSFKKGHQPKNYKENGSERVSENQYTKVKILDVWELKHRLIYEKYHGKIPKDHVIVFADGNKQNLDINNLIAISRHQLLIMNQKKLIKDNTELTKTGAILASVLIKMRERKKECK